MVIAEALCAMSLAANAMVDGMCCCYQMKQESKKQKEQEKFIRNAVRSELDLCTNRSNSDHEETNGNGEISNTLSTPTTASANINSNNPHLKEYKVTRSRDNLVQAYKDALLSRSTPPQEEEEESSPSSLQDEDPLVIQFQDKFSPPRSLSYLSERDQPPLQQQTQNPAEQPQSPVPFLYAPPIFSRNNSQGSYNRFPIGIPARHQSFSRVTTKKFDNTYKLEETTRTSPETNDHPDLFLYSSSSSSSSTTSAPRRGQLRQQPSFVNGYKLRKRSSLLPPIRTVSSLLEEQPSETNSEYNDSDHGCWLDLDKFSNSNNSNNPSSGYSVDKDFLQKEWVMTDVSSFESVSIE